MLDVGELRSLQLDDGFYAYSTPDLRLTDASVKRIVRKEVGEGERGEEDG